MRRNLFCVLLVIMAALYFIDMAGVPLRTGEMEGFIGRTGSYTAEITGLRPAGDGTYRLEAGIIEADGRKVNLSEKVLLGYYEELKEPWELLHSEISFQCTFEKPAGQRNPYCFDYGKYLKSRGIGAI